MKETGNIIRTIREKNGLTLSDFAEKINVQYQSVSLWEKGEAAPRFQNIRKIAEVFHAWEPLGLIPPNGEEEGDCHEEARRLNERLRRLELECKEARLKLEEHLLEARVKETQT